MEDENLRYIPFQDEVCRLRYIISKYKEHDKKRNRYITHLQKINDQQEEKIKRLESLTERQHEEIDELLDAYNGAKPLIADKAHRAYVYELIKRANDASKNRRAVEQLTKVNNQLTAENGDMKDRIKALETIVKNLYNGK